MAGPVTIGGGKGNDVINIHDQNAAVAGDYTVTSDGVVKGDFELEYSGVEELNVHAGGGGDTINVESSDSSTAVEVFAGGGDDTIHLSPTAQNLNTVRGPVTVHGEGDSDSVYLHDENFNAGGLFLYTISYTIDDDEVNRTFFGGLTHDTIEALTLGMGSGDDIVNMTGFNSDVLLSLYGNEGADTFNVTVDPYVPGQSGGTVFIDGGSPAGGQSGDRINVSHAPDPHVVHQVGQGEIHLDYDGPLVSFLVDYESIEDVTIEEQ